MDPTASPRVSRSTLCPKFNPNPRREWRSLTNEPDLGTVLRYFRATGQLPDPTGPAHQAGGGIDHAALSADRAQSGFPAVDRCPRGGRRFRREGSRAPDHAAAGRAAGNGALAARVAIAAHWYDAAGQHAATGTP